MVETSVDPDELSVLLAESTGTDIAELERQAEQFEIEDPEEADWEYLE